MIKILRLVLSSIMACQLVGCATQTDLQAQIGILRSGSFEESRQAGKAVLANPLFSYGIFKHDVTCLLGQADFQTEDGDDVCYRTGAGPLWFTFQNNQLIKKAVVNPPRWRGTDAELAKLWEEKRKTDTWYQW